MLEVQIEGQDQIHTKELVGYARVHLRLLTTPSSKLAQQVISIADLEWQKRNSLPATTPNKIRMRLEQPSEASSPKLSRKCHLSLVGLAAFPIEATGHQCTVEGHMAALASSQIIWVELVA